MMNWNKFEQGLDWTIKKILIPILIFAVVWTLVVVSIYIVF